MTVKRANVPSLQSSELKELREKLITACHILDHEDLGMMEVVEVIEPEGAKPLRSMMPMMHRH